MLTGALILVAAGAGGLFLLVQNKKPDASEETAAVTKPPPAAQPVAASTAPAAAPSASVPNQPAAQPDASAATVEAVARDPVSESPKPVPGADYVWVTPEPGKTIPVPSGAVDPAAIQLELAPPLERWTKTDDGTWSSIQADLALFLENAGARSNRAGDALVKAGRHAYPALVMGMMRQDWTTTDGVKSAGALNDLVAKIDAKTNFTWRSIERYEVGSDKWQEEVTYLKKGAIGRYNRWVSTLRTNDGEWAAIAQKGGSVGNTVVDEEGNQVGDVPPDLPPDAPPDGR